MSGEFEDEGDGGLLRRMCASGEKPAEGREAWSAFYQRHYRYLFGVCHRAYCLQIGDGRVCDLVQDTFLRAFQRACSFRDNGIMGLEGQRRMARAWLGGISEHVVSDYFRDQPLVDFVDPETFVDLNVGSVEPCADPSESLVEIGLRCLSDREQEVLRMTAFWYKPGEHHQRLPNTIMQQLATSLGTTSTNVRQIRLRAIAKVKLAMETELESRSTRS